MKKLFAIADSYVPRMTWKDVALLKVCLCAIGVLLGLCVPRRRRKWAALGAGAAFIATYIPLMSGFVPHLVRELREDGDAD